MVHLGVDPGKNGAWAVRHTCAHESIPSASLVRTSCR